MFCSKCGAKALDGAEFCQKCGEKLINDVVKQEQGRTSAPQIQGQPCNVPMFMPKKKKRKKWPIILGVIGGLLLLLVLVVVIGRGGDSNNQSQQISKDVNLSETYSNKEEGIYFEYPSAWKPVNGEGELESSINSNGGNILILLANESEDMPEENSYIMVSKFIPPQKMLDDMFIDDEQFAEGFDDNVTIQETFVTEIDGVPARKITYLTSDGDGFQSYYYAFAPVLYRIDFNYMGESAGDLQRFFDAIIDSYKISLSVSVDSDMNTDVRIDDIRFLDISIDELLAYSAVEVVQQFGGGYIADGEGMIAYEEIEFYMLDDQTVGYIWSFYPKSFSINGHALVPDSEGVIYSDAIIDLLGEDYEDELNESGYYMTYTYPTYMISFGVNEFSEVIDIKIYKYV